MKQCAEAHSNLHHANVQARVDVRAKAKHVKSCKWVVFVKEEKNIRYQGSVKYSHLDRTIRNHNTMPLPVTLDPLECKNFIRHINGTNNKEQFTLNNLHWNKTVTLLVDHYFQENLEQFQTHFTVSP